MHFTVCCACISMHQGILNIKIDFINSLPFCCIFFLKVDKILLQMVQMHADDLFFYLLSFSILPHCYTFSTDFL